MKFIRSRMDHKKNQIILYYKTDDNKIKKKYQPYNWLPPLTHKRKFKEYPPNNVSDSKIYNKINKCKFKYELDFNDLDF